MESKAGFSLGSYSKQRHIVKILKVICIWKIKLGIVTKIVAAQFGFRRIPFYPTWRSYTTSNDVPIGFFESGKSYWNLW